MACIPHKLFLLLPTWKTDKVIGVEAAREWRDERLQRWGWQSHPTSVLTTSSRQLQTKGEKPPWFCLNVFLSFFVTSRLDCFLTKVPSMSKLCFTFYRVSLSKIISCTYMCLNGCYLVLTECVLHLGRDYVLFTAAILVPRIMPII